MSRITIYLRGAIIGMIAEYCFRVDVGYLQVMILVALITTSVIDIIEHWKD